MADRWTAQTGSVVFLAALGTRLAGIVVTSLTTLNSYAQGDVDKFAAHAGEMAATLTSGRLPHVPANPNRIEVLWGLVLAPIWLLPGPNLLYGRLFSALLGAVAVYALYRLACSLHSAEAGVIATVPLVGYPSYVFVHSTVLRESFVLAGLVGATVLLVADGHRRRTTALRYVVAVGALALVTLVRWENLALYLLVIATGIAVRYRRLWPRSRVVAAVAGAVSLAVAVLARPAIQSGIDFLAVKRRRRSRGRTVYLAEFVPDTVLKTVAFAPVGALYFLFTPFPWMVETVADAVVFVEAVGNVVAFGLAVLGVPVLWRRSKSATAALVVGLLAGVVLYGLVNANVGTNVRQRQMFLWVVFLFAGVTVTERYDVERYLDWLP